MDALVAALRGARSVFVLTGSGISAESGLPTFRGVGGLWRTHRVEELASPQGFARDPVLVWTWYNERKAAHGHAQPNAGHVALARLERSFGDFTLATQNVDSLHLRAGSRNVLELHGDLREARCTGCGMRRALGDGGPAARRDRARLRRPISPEHRLVRRVAAAARLARGGDGRRPRRRDPRRRYERRRLSRRGAGDTLQRACVRRRDQPRGDADQRWRRLRTSRERRRGVAPGRSDNARYLLIAAPSA